VADIGGSIEDVRFGSLADIREQTSDVRFIPKSGHAQRQDPLSANRQRVSNALHFPPWATKKI